MLKRKVKTGAQRKTSAVDKPQRSHSFILLIVGAVGFLMFAYGGFLAQKLADPAAYPIKKIAIEGEFQYIDAEQLEDVVSHAIEGGFFSVDVAAVRRQILDEPWIYDASVRRVWPDAIRVSIREQQPLARWRDFGLLNKDADIFAPQSIDEFDQLVQLEGPIGTEAELMARYVRIRERLRGVGLKISRLTLSERRALSVQFDDGTQLVIGRHEIAARIDRFSYVFATVLKSNWHSVATVDMRYTNGFAVREKETNQDNG